MEVSPRDKREAFKLRTKSFALLVLSICDEMPRNVGSGMIARQMARSAGSVAANYRAACRARSDAECIAKLGIAEEEADETLLWLELAQEGGYVAESTIAPLWKECNEIVAILVTSIKRLKAKAKQ